ncbi:MAG: hypothetical protein KKA79_00985 [Nanoarchaeota archaeon]|nr:hypothetical protein [Nanoarchaeota archaeon]
MKAIKQITAILLLLVGLLVVSSAALATPTSFEVEVNDEDLAEGGSSFYAERGGELEIEIKFEFDEIKDDLKIKTWLGGYEYEDVEDSTSMFDYPVANVLMKKVLNIELPNDMDASEEYFLHVELYNHDYVHQVKYKLQIEEQRHRLDIQDVILRPSTVTAGSAMFATVRVENMGDKKEENIKVTVSIPDLGVSARTYIDELVSEEDLNKYDEDEIETSESSEEMRLTIPQDAAEGDYAVEVTLSYNRNKETVTHTETVHVKAADATATATAPETLVSVDGTSKELAAGIESAFKIMVANLGDSSAVYSVEIAGTELWATARVEPAMVTLGPDSTGEMYVYVKPKEDAEAGTHSFTAKVKSGNTIVKETTLTADVTGSATSTTTAATAGETNFASLKNALVIGFGVLVVLLVILGLIIAFNKMNSNDDEEIPASEGQAYY